MNFSSLSCFSALKFNFCVIFVLPTQLLCDSFNSIIFRGFRTQSQYFNKFQRKKRLNWYSWIFSSNIFRMPSCTISLVSSSIKKYVQPKKKEWEKYFNETRPEFISPIPLLKLSFIFTNYIFYHPAMYTSERERLLKLLWHNCAA